MEIVIGAMINGVFIKKGSKVKMAVKNYDSFYAVVTYVDEKRIDFVYKDDNGNWWDDHEDWSNLDFVELVR